MNTVALISVATAEHIPVAPLTECWIWRGSLVEAGISVIPPYKLYALTDLGRAALLQTIQHTKGTE